MSVFSAIGSAIGMGLNYLQGNKQMDMQKQFAQKGIQWRVADATKAGLHPLAALGANTASFSPVSVGDMSAPLESMGQNVDRAIDATRNGTEKMNTAMGALALEKSGLENDLLRSQIAQLNRQPPMPTDGGAGQLIPGQGQTLVMSDGTKIVTPPGMTPGQDIENLYGESGEPMNIYNMWHTIRNNPAAFAKMAAKLGYSITPFGAAQQYLPEKLPSWLKSRTGSHYPPTLRRR